jgi:hypothetical protein
LRFDDHPRERLWRDRGCQANQRSQEEPTVARRITAAFVVMDTMMERLRQLMGGRASPTSRF